MRASQNLRAQAPITEEQSENSETESDEGDKDVDYAQLLGEEYRPRSDCTGNPYPVRCTLLRSLGKWSGGLMETEKGIQNAYKHFIESAQHYIYIENQFFVSGMRGNGRVTNTLAQCLYARIMKAAMSKSKFKVLILIPLLPAMEGPVKGGALSSIAGVMYWQYRSICSGGNSLLEELEKSGVDPSKYIKFIGLRTHEKMSTGWQTEMVYIHSKLMIVDDKTTIIGSANMNDRSMVGSKDSEICILTEDTKFEDSSMSDAPYRAGLFSKSLRMKAWGEFCGIKADDKVGLKRIEDPSSDATWNYLDNLALSNTSKYEQVFKDLVPSNRIKKGDDLHGSGTSSGEVKDGDFKRRMSMAGGEAERGAKTGGRWKRSDSQSCI
jgi:phospholipase D1/2